MPIFSEVVSFLNANLFTTIVGSLVGAFAGAHGAQKIAERAKRKDDLVKELRNTNAAMSVAFGIANSILGLKKQHIKVLWEKFNMSKSELEDFKRKRESGQIGRDSVFEFRAELLTLALPKMPVELLQDLIFERISLVGRPLNLANILVQTVDDLHGLMARRNDLIESYKKSNKMIPIENYFGLPNTEGHVNEDFPTYLEGMNSLTDDVIYFSALLVQDLANHGTSLKKRYLEDFGKGGPRVSEIDFSKAKKDGLMPSEDKYKDWTNSFRTQEESGSNVH